MSADRDEHEGAEDETNDHEQVVREGEPPDDPAVQAPFEAAPSMGEADGEDAAPHTINLDRYLSRRRPPVQMGWPQIFSMVAMLTALIMILMFKSQCGSLVSSVMHTVAPGEHPEPTEPAIRYQPPPADEQRDSADAASPISPGASIR